jgi:Allophanate hydrolase C-terminal domain
MSKFIDVAVCGAHMRGLPLNYQLTELDARFVKATSTAKGYRLFEVPNKVPPRPGMIRDMSCDVSLELEVWKMPLENFGAFMIQIASPLCIGSVILEDGTIVYGFLCESDYIKEAEEISFFGGWKAYLESKTISAT